MVRPISRHFCFQNNGGQRHVWRHNNVVTAQPTKFMNKMPPLLCVKMMWIPQKCPLLIVLHGHSNHTFDFKDWRILPSVSGVGWSRCSTVRLCGHQPAPAIPRNRGRRAASCEGLRNSRGQPAPNQGINNAKWKSS